MRPRDGTVGFQIARMATAAHRGTYLAAVRACGEGALLAGRAAGHLLGALRGSPPRPEVIAPTKRRIAGVTTRRYRHLDPRDATTWRAIPVTAVARTLVDL